MTASLIPTPVMQFFDSNGDPLVGGKVYTYAAGTSTPLATYTDQGGATPNANPVILDSRGEAAIWFGGSSYKLVLKTSADVLIWTADNVTAALASLAASSGSSLVGFLPAGTGAVATTAQAKMRESVSTKDFGAVGDQTTDDTAAVQLAINAALAAGVGLKVVGMCKLTSSLMIDRAVDTTTDYFEIFSDSGDNGFYTSTAINLFSSNIAMPTTAPVSETVFLNGLKFEASSSAVAAYVMSGKFLRVRVKNCSFYAIKFMATTGYMQTYRFTENFALGWAGYLIATQGSFDVELRDNVLESGGAFFRSYDSSGLKGCAGTRVEGNLFESGSGAFVEAGYSKGIVVAGNHLENNTGVTLNLDVGGTNYSAVITGNYITSKAANIANGAFYEINLGTTSGILSGGNFTDGRLFANNSIPAAYPIESHGDVAFTLLASDLFGLSNTTGTFTPACTLGALGTVNQATYRRTENVVTIQMDVVMPASASGSPAIIISLPWSATANVFGGSVNYTNLGSTIYLTGGSTFAGGAGRILLCSDLAATPITYATLSGKRVVLTTTYSIG